MRGEPISGHLIKELIRVGVHDGHKQIIRACDRGQERACQYMTQVEAIGIATLASIRIEEMGFSSEDLEDYVYHACYLCARIRTEEIYRYGKQACRDIRPILTETEDEGWQGVLDRIE